MKKMISGLCLALLLSNVSYAEEKFWTDGADQPASRVNTDLKNLSPKAYLNVSEKVNQA
ncbi:MAG: hypothetical protein IT286_00145, partial [Proteobacteria bacterium]|nr:hypothetical protein [Pseudomonadota bacterium]